MTGKLPKKIELGGGDFQLVPYRTKVLNPASSSRARYVCYLWPVRSDSDRTSKPQEIVSDENVPLYAWLTDDSQFTFGVRQWLRSGRVARWCTWRLLRAQVRNGVRRLQIGDSRRMPDV